MENYQPVQQPIFSSFGMSLSLLNLNKQKAMRQISRTSKILSDVDIETTLIKKSIVDRLESFKAREKSIDQQAKKAPLIGGRPIDSRLFDEGSDTDTAHHRRHQEINKALLCLDRRKTGPSLLVQQASKKINPFEKISKSKLTYPIFEKPAQLEQSSEKWTPLTSTTLTNFANEHQSNSKSAHFGLSKRKLPFELSAAPNSFGEDQKKPRACKNLHQPEAALSPALSSVNKLRGIINYDRMVGRPELRRLSFPESGQVTSKVAVINENRRATFEHDSPVEDCAAQDFTFRKMEDSKHQASHSSLISIREKSASRASPRKKLTFAAKPSPFALQLGRQSRHKKHSTRDSKLSSGDVCYNLVRQASPSIKIKTGDYFGSCRVTITSPKISKPHFIITRKLQV